MDEAEFCNRLALMYRGRIVALGAPAELKQKMGLATMEDVFVATIEEEERRSA
jgi:ABC-2 type transport system ATP-binding protein